MAPSTSGIGDGSVENYTSDACGGGVGGSLDEEAHDTCEEEGGGGGRLMDGVVTNTSGLGRGRRIRSVVDW